MKTFQRTHTPDTNMQPTDVILLDVKGNELHTYGLVNTIIEFSREKCTVPTLVCDIQMDGILGQDFLLKK